MPCPATRYDAIPRCRPRIRAAALSRIGPGAQFLSHASARRGHSSSPAIDRPQPKQQPMAKNPDDTAELLEQARHGDAQALEAIFARYRDRLLRMVEIRLDVRLRACVDASDVIQESYLEVVRRLDDYLRNPTMPLFLWLRFLVGERLMILHRHHLGTQMRDARRHVSLYQKALPTASTTALAACLLGKRTSPFDAAVRAERAVRLQEAINTIDPIDREVLALRHFEQLTRAETAQVLGITEPAAAKRYVRALKRLKEILAKMPGGMEEL